jgi:hypothetical protein
VGEKESEPFQFTFNGFLRVAFQGSRVTSDAGLVLVRELDERLGLEAIIGEHMRDSRHGLNTQFPLPDLLRQSIYSRLAGYEDLNDADRLSTDPTFRLIGSPKRWDRSVALTSTLHWFETELLTREENLVGLMAVNRAVIGQAETFDRSDRTVLDMDSSESPVHGQQEGSAFNGHFESVCYHPLFLFNDHGDCLAAKLRSGNVSSADDWDELLLPEIERQQAEGQRVAFRADAAFARPAIYEALEARGVRYAIRIPRLSCHRFRANEVRLLLSVLAYNLGNLCRRLVLPVRIDTWSVTSLQQRLVKTGGRLVKHARYYWLILAESHLTRRLFGSILRRIWALPAPTG